MQDWFDGFATAAGLIARLHPTDATSGWSEVVPVAVGSLAAVASAVAALLSYLSSRLSMRMATESERSSILRECLDAIHEAGELGKYFEKVRIEFTAEYVMYTTMRTEEEERAAGHLIKIGGCIHALHSEIDGLIRDINDARNAREVANCRKLLIGKRSSLRYCQTSLEKSIDAAVKLRVLEISARDIPLPSHR